MCAPRFASGWGLALRLLAAWCAVSSCASLALAGEEAEHEYHRHHFGAFLGAATRAAEGGGHDHGFAGGLDYEYRFSRWVGAGVLAEGATGDLRDGVFAGLLFAHPWRDLVLAAGPGLEVTSDATEYLTRFGLAYQFPIAPHLTLAPEFSVDLVKREPVYVYGLVLGFGF